MLSLSLALTYILVECHKTNICFSMECPAVSHSQNSEELTSNMKISHRFPGPLNWQERRAVCTKGRDLINASWWLLLTRNSLLKIKNCNDLSPSLRILTGLPYHSGKGRFVAFISVAHVLPRTSKGITDLFLPQVCAPLTLPFPAHCSLSDWARWEQCAGLSGLGGISHNQNSGSLWQ